MTDTNDIAIPDAQFQAGDVLDGVEFAHHQKGVSIPAIPSNVTCMPLPYRLFMADRGIP